MTQEAQVVKWNCPCGNSIKFHGFTEAPQRTWVGLTDAEKESLWEKGGNTFLIEKVETLLKEKNT